MRSETTLHNNTTNCKCIVMLFPVITEIKFSTINFRGNEVMSLENINLTSNNLVGSEVTQ